jgi:hypothetical protein
MVYRLSTLHSGVSTCSKSLFLKAVFSLFLINKSAFSSLAEFIFSKYPPDFVFGPSDGVFRLISSH